MANNNRYTTIDTAKGLGIILVVLFHLPNLDKLPYVNYYGGWIVTFYMPLFFVISGLFGDLNKNPINRCKRLLVPTFSFYLIGFSIYALKNYFKQIEVDWSSFLMLFKGSTIGYENTPIWFLLSLAEITIMGWVVTKILNNRYLFCASIIIGFVGYLFGLYGIAKPYYINVSMLCLPFFIGGMQFKNEFFQKRSVWIYLMALASSFCIFLVTPEWTNLSQNSIPSGLLPFVIVSALATYALIGLSHYIDKLMFLNKVLRFYGKNSLIILCTHMMLMIIPRIIATIVPNFILSTFIALIIIMIAEIPIIWIINHYMPFLLGINNYKNK